VNWYVAVTGNDSFSCTTPQQPCQHIQVAIDRAASGDIINIAAGTYIEEQLLINDRNLTLIGESANTTFLDGNNLYQVLSIQRESLPTMTVNIANVTIQRGQSDQPGGGIATEDNIHLTLTNSNILSNTASFGGGIFNQGILKLTDVILRGNNASTTGTSEGGAMWNTGFADLTNTTVSNNEAQRGGGISSINVLTLTNSLVADNKTIGEYGGGIYNRSVNGRTTLVNSVVSGNRAIGTDGGGIYNEGILISSGSLISGNLALVSGGGIYNKASANVTLTDVTFQANHSINTGGALFNNGTATLTDLTVRNNLADDAGGGLYNSDAGRLYLENSNVLSNTTAAALGGGIGNLGVLTLTRSSLLYNSSATSLQGGGLYNANTAQLTNATISNNTAAAGGAVHNISGTLTIQFSTISYNSAPALNRTGGTVTVNNSLLVQSTGAACSGSITSANYNVDSGNTCGFAQSHDLINTDPQLGPLRDNGGNSLTRSIGFGSPAQDTAVVPCPLAVDQRGIARPQFDICDRGAYEVAGYSNPSPIDIGPSQCITSLLSIGDQFAVGRLLAGVNLTYTDRADLTVRLLAPSVVNARLLGPGANSGQNLDTLFDDSAPETVPGGDQLTTQPFYEGPYKPVQPLQRFIGVNMKGTWRLEVCNSGDASGSLNRWVLVVPEISDFKVYLPVMRR
jgi:subtilisin-like proprotein convertase family protein